MVRRKRGVALWRRVAWRELWMGMALGESVALVALYFWYSYLH